MIISNALPLTGSIGLNIKFKIQCVKIQLGVFMPANDKTQIVIFGIMMSALAATVTAMLSKEGNVLTKVKTFIAGVCFGIVLTLIMLNTQLSQAWKDVIIASGSAFVSTFWPMLSRVTVSLAQSLIHWFFSKFTKAKPDDILPKP